jgi:hypothetical protein
MQDAGLSNDQIGQIGQAQKIKLDPPANPKADEPQQGQSEPSQADAPVDANKDGKDDTTGKPIATPTADAPVDVNKDGKDDATGKPIPKATGTAPGAPTSTAPDTPAVDLKTLADEIKKSGPDIVALVLKQLAVKTKPALVKKAKTGGKIAGKVSQTPNAIRKRNARAAAKQKVAASIDHEVDSLIAELDRVLH